MYNDWSYPAEDNEVTTKDSLYLIRDRAEIKNILYNPIKYEKAAGECDGDSTLNHPNPGVFEFHCVLATE